MTFQNRVDPFGAIVAVPSRGMFMGNRGGCFHDDSQRLTRARWASRQWITCVLEFKGRRRKLMQPGLYTELFFLDEATALAAGHRPCFECRHPDANRFFEALCEANPRITGAGERLRVDTVDRMLHVERVDATTKTQRTTPATLGELPDGVLVTLGDEPRQAYLKNGGQLLAWSFDGYGAALALPGGSAVTVLTPPTTVAALRCGYEPVLHPSAVR